MTRIRFFIRKVNDMRLLSKMQSKMQSHAKFSHKNYSMEQTEIENVDNEPQYVRPTKDIPGPKALPLIGNLFKFMPYIGKSYFINT